MLYLLYLVGSFLACNFPRGFVCKIATCLGNIAYLVKTKDRENVIYNLNQIFKDTKTVKEKNYIARKIFQNFNKYLVDFLRIDKINDKIFAEIIKLEGLTTLEELKKQQKGIVLLASHMGNWELGAMATALAGYQVNVIYQPQENKKIDELFVKQRLSKNLQLIPLGIALKNAFRALKNAEIVAIMGDMGFGAYKSVKIDFFGQKKDFPVGPAELALKTEAVVVPAFAIRLADETYKGIIEKPIIYNPTGNLAEDAKEIITKYVQLLEKYIYQYPEQWLVFNRI